ncbi:MAG: outer membrane protein assembly factor BamC [Pseudomonadales bacterium]
MRIDGMVARLVTLTMVAWLAGCSWLNDDEGVFVDRRDDYLTAAQKPPLVVPDGLTADALTDPFPIPPTPEQVNAEFFPKQPPLPDAIYTGDNRGEVRIQRLSTRRWLAVPESPVTVWPKLKQFLAENGMTVTYEQPADGRIDTDWFVVQPATQQTYRDVVRLVLQESRKNSNLATGRERLRIRLERGMQELSSEIHVREENDSQGLPSPPGVASLNGISSSLPEAEDELLRELGAYIAARVSEQTVSRVAANISGVQKAELARDTAGHPVLRLRLDYERAWAALSKALENGGVEILSADDGAGVYTIRVPESVFTGKEPGFFSRMLSLGRKKSEDLRVMLTGEGESFDVTVQDGSGGAPADDLSQQVLVLIKEYAV